MRKLAGVILIVAVVVGARLYLGRTTVQAVSDGPSYTADSKLILPVGYRKWCLLARHSHQTA